MHELSIAQNIVDIVGQYVPSEQMDAVRSVRLRVGSLSGIVPESLDFCFAAIVSGTALSRAALAIEQVPTRAKCRDCGISFPIDDSIFICSSCGGTGIQVLSGTELQVVEIELADQNEAV